jgi:predicted ATPase
LAEQQGALFCELRSALAFWRLWTTQGRKADARQVLAPLCGAFAVGVEIADVRAARALLDGFDVAEK